MLSFYHLTVIQVVVKQVPNQYCFVHTRIIMMVRLLCHPFSSTVSAECSDVFDFILTGRDAVSSEKLTVL